MKTNIPKLRFVEFKDAPAWKEQKLGEVCTIRRGSSPRPIQDFINKGDLPWLKITDINNLKVTSVAQTINEDGARQGLFAPKGSFIYTNSATPGLPVILDAEAYLNDGFLKLDLDNNINNLFLKMVLYGKRDHILSKGAGSIFTNLNKDIVSKVNLSIPSICEQEKIGKFLSTLDKRIELQEQLIEKLEEEKKGYLQKLFPKKGKNIPELRFEEFKDDAEWDNITLDTVMSVPIHSRVENPSIDKIVRVRMHLNGLTRVPDNSTLDLSATNYYYRKLGQFIYGKQNIFNGCFDIVNNEYDKSYSSGDVTSLDFKENFDSIFTYYCFSRKSFYTSLERFAKGSGSKRLHEADLLKVSVNYPKIDEQVRIKNFLNEYKKRLQIEKKLLVRLHNLKEYTLHNCLI